MNFNNYRITDIKNNLNKIGVHPLDVMVTGVTGAGKSTTLNTFFQKDVAEIGSGVDPKTMELTPYKLNDFFRLWDTPGLGDNVNIDQIHKKNILNLLYKTYSFKEIKYGIIDMVIVVIEGSNRDMGTTYTLLNEIIVPNIERDRILVIINQADMAMKGRHWNYSTCKPDSQLISFLENQSISIQKRIKEATGISILKPVYYSAEYKWNIESVFDFIIDNMPHKKRSLLNKL